MQFRKTAVAVAIAGIAAVTPQIASADTVLSGAVTIGFFGNDSDTQDLDDDGLGLDTDEGEPTLGVDEAVIGIIGTHTIIGGLTGYASARLDADGFSGSNTTSDSVYVGIRGGFGDVRIGEVPVAAEYGQVAGDIFDQSDDVNEGIAYTGNFGPVTLGATYSPERNEEVIGLGARFNIGSFAVGLGGNQRGPGNQTSFSIGASAAFAGVSVAAHFVSREDPDESLDDTTIVGVNVGYGIAGVSLGLSYFLRSTDQAVGLGEDLDETVVRLDAGYGLGGGMSVSSRINFIGGDVVDNQNDDINSPDATEVEYRILLSKSF